MSGDVSDCAASSRPPNDPPRSPPQRPWRVLVFPGGTECGLEINRALRDCKDVELFSGGLSNAGAAEFRFRRHFEIPTVDDPGMVQRLARIVAENAIDFIYPAHDDVILSLSAIEEQLAAPLITSRSETCEIARSKSATYRALANVVSVPTILDRNGSFGFPVFVKPDRGQGSRGARLIADRFALDAALRDDPSLLIMEYLPGEEFTIDCFSSRRKGLIFAGARKRTRAQSGIAMNSITVDDPEFEATARAIGNELEFRGAWFYQMKRDARGVLKLLEVAPRIAGTMALTRVRGVNFPLLSLYEAAGVDIEISPIPQKFEIARSLENSYRSDLIYSAVYVDLDDTLIIRGEVNTRLVRFLYQCVNRRIPIHLLTRHRDPLFETLAKHRLGSLFDNVHHLTDRENKADHIAETDAILIDDSYRERSLVANARGIAVFDPTSIECLLDDRG